MELLDSLKLACYKSNNTNAFRIVFIVKKANVTCIHLLSCSVIYYKMYFFDNNFARLFSWAQLCMNVIEEQRTDSLLSWDVYTEHNTPEPYASITDPPRRKLTFLRTFCAMQPALQIHIVKLYTTICTHTKQPCSASVSCQSQTTEKYNNTLAFDDSCQLLCRRCFQPILQYNSTVIFYSTFHPKLRPKRLE